ncbi:hypothetical protein ACWC4A_53310, partial [Streptomyces mirabilis]
MSTRIDGLLLDMNGLFRHWKDTGAQKSERLAHLPEGTITRYAYEHPSYRLARVGVLTDEQWAQSSITSETSVSRGSPLAAAWARLARTRFLRAF